MAFVIPKSQKKSSFEPKYQSFIEPGPGQYNIPIQNIKNASYCAPFNNSSVKVSYFDVKQANSGPGQYQPRHYKDLNKQNFNKGYVFASKVDRFKTQNQDYCSIRKTQPSLKLIYYDTQNRINRDNIEMQRSKLSNFETQYSIKQTQTITARKQIYAEKLKKSKSVIQEIRQQNSEHRVQSIKGKKDFIRVILTNSTNTQNLESRYVYKDVKGKGLGPGSYQHIDFKIHNRSITNWSLNKQKRFKTQSNGSPGPGSYQLIEQNDSESKGKRDSTLASGKNKRLSSSFASTVIRSHMDSIIYKTNIPFKAALIEDHKIKDMNPGPGTYNPDSSIQEKTSFNYGSETCFSSSKRDLGNQSQSNGIGPGSYQVNLHSMSIYPKQKKCNPIIKNMRNQIFGRKGKIASNFNKNNTLSRSYSQRVILQSESNLIHSRANEEKKKNKMTKFCSLDERCFSKLGNMSQQQRFKNNPKKVHQLVPGPGDYYNENIASGFGANEIMKKGGTSVFKSITSRNTFENKAEQLPFYNIIRNDIGYKAQKLKRYIENLKRINIWKTPFQTSVKRFEQKEIDLNSNFSKSVHQQTQLQLANKEKVKNPSSSFKSSTKRELYKSQKKPGPGDYNSQVKSNGVYTELEKRSFNKNYGYMKIRPNKDTKDKFMAKFDEKNAQESRKQSIQNVKLMNKNQFLPQQKTNQQQDAKDNQ